MGYIPDEFADRVGNAADIIFPAAQKVYNVTAEMTTTPRPEAVITDGVLLITIRKLTKEDEDKINKLERRSNDGSQSDPVDG